MWSCFIAITSIVTLATIIAGELVSEGPGGIKSYLSPGVTSVDSKLIYGDEDMVVINEVINSVEKQNALKKSINLNDSIKPLPAQDVKCIMSVDRYCSKEMGEIKKVMIQAVSEDCAKCTSEEKEKAGKVIASILAHDPVAWKLFLTRSALLTKKREQRKEFKPLKFKEIGEPEEVVSSPHNRYVMSGVEVRVKRYVSEIVP